MGNCQEQPKNDDVPEDGSCPPHLYQEGAGTEEDEQETAVRLPTQLPQGRPNSGRQAFSLEGSLHKCICTNSVFFALPSFFLKHITCIR